ncbi:MAG: TonB-dependent receptor [Sphingomonas sp.]|uniref:TonB-dependent receptor plug domain-containing protein n=1 Tax=Sphingomonas sp. TaxID=28214 RepID=UPI0012247E9C|nr:TonB-dependent receptor [Sphingomonas sp.]THD34832.1 MAG: TonB-dependent receptor [Sphingomonas sp.]
MLKSSLFAATALPLALFATPARAQGAPPKPDQTDQQVVDETSQDIVGVFSLPLESRKDIVISSTGVAELSDRVGQAVTVIDRDTIERRQTVALSDLLATTAGVTVTRNGGPGGFTAVRIRGAEGEQTLTLIDGVRVNDPSSPGGGFDFANLLAGSIDRVEVLRGPNSVPWGSQAIGGVVDVITTKPRYGLQARGNIEYGSFDSVTANAGVSGRSGIFSGALDAGYLRTDGISAAANGTERDGYRQYGATGRIGVDLSDDVGIDVRAYYADSRVENDGFPAPAYVLADTPEYSTAKEFYGYAGLHAKAFGGAVSNRLGFAIADIDRDNFASPVTRAKTSLARGRTERFEYQGDWQVADPLRLVLGAEHERTRFRAQSFGAFGSNDAHASWTTSVYGEAIVTPLDRLTLTGGVRYDDNRDFGGHTTFGANAAYNFGGTTLRASYAEGFKAPTLYQRFAAFYGVPTLKPESAQSYDLGISQTFLGERLRAEVTWFHRDTINQIDFDPATFTYANIARTRAEGAEVELEIKPVDGLTVSGNLSYIDATNRAPGALFGRSLLRRPKLASNISVDYRLPVGLSLGATVSLVGDSIDVDDFGNRVPLDGYAVAGVRAEMPIGKRFAVYGRVDNLFDAKYQTVRGYGTPGRAAYGGVRLRFE